MKRPRQAELAFPTRGRPRNPDPERTREGRLRHNVRPHVSPQYPVHVTVKLHPNRPLRFRAANRALRGVLHAVQERRPGFRVLAYSLQSNHLHFVVEGDTHAAFLGGVRSLDIRLAIRLNRVLGRKGRLFSEVHHRRELKTPREVRNALAYVLLNHRRHAPKAAPLLDPFSAAAWFDGWRVPIQLPPDPPPIQRARTWLGAIGWRRHGLLSSEEVPGRASHI
jgi:REP element-mobilizing transposase RayT